MGRLARALGGDRLEGAADALLNDILNTNRYGKIHGRWIMSFQKIN